MKGFKTSKKNIILAGAALIAAVLSICLPEKLIFHTKNNLTDVCMDVPEEYYPTSSYYEVTKEFSEKLSEYQKRQLISGAWVSEITPVDKEYYSDSGYHIQEMAKDKINVLSEDGFYPGTIESSYKQWYNWKCTYMQALDTNFRTYAGFFWKTSFTHFESGERMTVFLTADGRVLKMIYTSGEEEKAENVELTIDDSKKILRTMLGTDFEITSVKDSTEQDVLAVNTYLQSDRLTTDLAEGESDDTNENSQESSEENTEKNIEENTAQNGDMDYKLEVKRITVLDLSVDSSDTTGNDYYLYIYQSDSDYAIGLIPVE